MPRFLLLLTFLLFTSYFLLLFPSPAYAQGCSCDVSSKGSAGVCSSGCDHPGIPCYPDSMGACSAQTEAECSQLPDKTWVTVLRACVDFGEFAGILMSLMIAIAGGLAVIRLIAGGLAYIYSSGDPSNLENAMAIMTSSIFGLMLVLVAYVIMRIVQGAIPGSWELWLLGK